MNKEKLVLPTFDWIVQDDRIIVQRLEPEKRSPTGLIIIPEIAQEEAHKGIVLEVGEWAKYHPETLELRKGMIPQIGDVILFGKYAGAEWEEMVDGKNEKLLTMRIVDIMCIRKTNIWDEPRNK